MAVDTRMGGTMAAGYDDVTARREAMMGGNGPHWALEGAAAKVPVVGGLWGAMAMAQARTPH